MSHIEIPHIYGVHNAVATDAGVEDVVIDKNITSLFAYPNPASQGEIITLSINDDYPYNIYSISGALVATGEGRYINTATLTSGVYFISCNNLMTKIIIK